MLGYVVCIGIGFFLTISSIYGQSETSTTQDVEAPFNMSDIIERVSHHPIKIGNTIVIKDRVYEAFFDDDGVILKARETRGDAKDLVIPISSIPEIRDGKVIYKLEGGEIVFEGNTRGLRFHHTVNNRFDLNYTGNVAKLCYSNSHHHDQNKSCEKSMVSAQRYQRQSDNGVRDGEFLIDTNIVYIVDTNWQVSPSVAFDGVNYLVVWHDDRNGYYFDIYGTRINQAGVVLDSLGIEISTVSGDQFVPSVAFDGTNYLVVWEDWRSGTYDYDIYGARVTQTGTVLDPGGIAISTKANWERYPSVTFDGTNYLVVWDEKRSVSSDIYGSRVSQTGIVLDPEGIAISTGTGDQFASSIAFDGTNYLVVWEDYNSGSSDIYGARVNQDGLVLDPVGIAITTALNEQLDAHVVFDGNNYLVVWQDYRNDPTEFANPDVYGSRVNQSGVVLDSSGIALAYVVYYQWYPSIAFDGTNYLVVWEDYRSGSSDIYGARVSQSGIVLDPDCIAISTGISEQWYPSVAFDGTNYLAVWEDRRSGSYDIYGARVSLTGTVLDPTGITISAAENAQRTPSITFDGANYLVVWADGRSGSSADLYGAEVNILGTVVDSFAVSVQTGNQLTPALVHGQGDQLLVVYCGFVDYINTHAANTLRIWGKFFPIPGIEENISMPNIRTLLKIYPNPFNQMTEIRCQITDDRLSMTNSRAQIKIYNVSGQVIKSFNLTPDVLPFTSVISWDGTNAKGQKVPAGVYFCSLETDGFTTNQKIIKTR